MYDTELNFSANICELDILVKDSLTDTRNWFGSNGLLLNEEKTVNIIFIWF